MKKQNAMIFGPFVGELGWEILRFAPHAIWHKMKKYNDGSVVFIIYTRPDRMDLYGNCADIVVPLRIEGDVKKYSQNCFRLDHYPLVDYKSLTEKIYVKYAQRFNIINHVYPDISPGKFLLRTQFPKDKMIYDFCPRINNFIFLKNYLNNGSKKNVVISPRFRSGMQRNWPHWEKFYDLIYEDRQLMEKFNFIICGKSPDYIPDKKNRFFDINSIPHDPSISLIGLTICAIKSSVLLVGSQSGLPNLSLLIGTEVLEFGHQKSLHSRLYNMKRTKITFLEDRKYNLQPSSLLQEMKKILATKNR